MSDLFKRLGVLEVESARWKERAQRAEAVVSHNTYHIAKLVDRAELAERLLMDILEWLTDDRLTKWKYMEDDRGFYTDRRNWIKRINSLMSSNGGRVDNEV